MKQQPGIPPDLEQQIRQRMAAGAPLPPGVVAVPQGTQPPPGAVPTGIVAPAPGRPLQAAQMPGARPQAINNPLPEGDQGIEILRNMSDCPIPAESKKLNELIKKLVTTTPEDDDIVEKTLSKGLTVVIRANRYCTQQIKTRTVCIFEEDEVLAQDHKQLNELTEELDELHKKLQDCVARGQKVLQHRWNYAVKTYGLAPDKFSYRVDEEKGIIEQIELRCQECKGATTIKKARQETAAALETLKIKRKDDTNAQQGTESENNNTNGAGKGSGNTKQLELPGTTSCSDGSDRKACMEEQKVPVVADIPTSDGNNGSSSPEVAE